MLALQLAINGILLGGLYVLLAQSLNLFIVVAGLFTYWFTIRSGVSPLVVLPMAFIAMGAIGALVQRFLIEPLMRFGSRAELLSLMITFGLSYLLVDLALQLWGADFVS